MVNHSTLASMILFLVLQGYIRKINQAVSCLNDIVSQEMASYRSANYLKFFLGSMPPDPLEALVPTKMIGINDQCTFSTCTSKAGFHEVKFNF